MNMRFNIPDNTTVEIVGNCVFGYKTLAQRQTYDPLYKPQRYNNDKKLEALLPLDALNAYTNAVNSIFNPPPPQTGS